MADNLQGGTPFLLNSDASAACITGLVAALHAATELVVFPDRVKVDQVSPSSRLEFVSEEMKRCVKDLYTEGMSERDEADGFTTALQLIDDSIANIRKHV